jgi:hypothetical protein
VVFLIFFFFFTILFITISVLFSCKGIQQKLLKRSCPQNGAARLPFLGVSHLLLVPRGGEAGGLLPKKVSNPRNHGGDTRDWRACLEGILNMAISEIPLEWGWGLG